MKIYEVGKKIPAVSLYFKCECEWTSFWLAENPTLLKVELHDYGFLGTFYLKDTHPCHRCEKEVIVGFFESHGGGV